VLYVAGYGRSGSTLLNRLLGQQPGVCGAGELSRYALWSESVRPCSCGRPIASCAFWSRVRDGRPSTTGRSRWDAVIDSAATLMFGYWWVPAKARASYRDAQQALFRSIAAASGSTVIVDCSKSAIPGAGRARALRHVAGLEISIIHLVRNPQAVRESLMRGTNKELEGRVPRGRRLRRIRSFVGWAVANAAARRLSGRHFAGSSCLVRYEELMAEPARTLHALEQSLGIGLGRAVAVAGRHAAETPVHVAEGNRMRHLPLLLLDSGPASATLIDRWLCVMICGLQSRRLGYGVSGTLQPGRQSRA